MIKRIWRLLIELGFVLQSVLFSRYIDKVNHSQLNYSQSKDNWEKQNKLVHGDIGDEYISRMAGYIKGIVRLESQDIVLDVGCGDGLIDSKLVDFCNKIYGYDFSGSKVSNAIN